MYGLKTGTRAKIPPILAGMPKSRALSTASSAFGINSSFAHGGQRLSHFR